MNCVKWIQLIAWGVISVLIISCSSTSVQKRYNKPPEKTEDSKKGARFTSEDDPNPKEEEYTTYRNQPEFDEEPIEDHPVDIERFVNEYSDIDKVNSELTQREQILFEIIKYVNTPYQYGGETKKGIDCSAFTQNVYNNTVKYKLPRTASEQYLVGEKIEKESQLSFGDLIFFNTTKNRFPGHVGIYMGESLFAHASQSQGVTVSSLKSAYYQTRFVGGKRITDLK